MNLKKEALEQKITSESFEQFRETVFNSFQHIDIKNYVVYIMCVYDACFSLKFT